MKIVSSYSRILAECGIFLSEKGFDAFCKVVKLQESNMIQLLEQNSFPGPKI